MKIIYYDGSILEGHTIYFTERELIVDDIYNVPLVEVLRIEED
jgi:hypothetical protein